MGSDKARPAYVEDVEEDQDSENNRTIRGTRVSARATKKDKKQRQEKRVAKEKKKSQSDDGYSSLAVPTRADERATVKEVRVIPDREPREGRRKSLNIAPGKSPRKSSRPPAQRNVTFDHSDLPSRPKDRDDPRYFGERGGHPVVIQAQSTPRPAPSSASSQSRQARPMSINGSRPPLSGSAFYPQPIYTAGPIMIPPQYPNPMQMAYSPNQPSSSSRKTLMDRFARTGASITRPQSASGYRPSDLQVVERGIQYDDYDSEAEEEQQQNQAALMQEAMRIKELRRRAKELQDAQDMPPPQPMARRRSVRQPSEQSIFLQDQLDDEPQPRRSRDDEPRDYRRSRDSREYDRRPSGDYERPSPRRPSPRRPSPRRPSPRRHQSRTSYEFDERERPAQNKIIHRGDAPQQSRARRQSLPRAPESSESLSFDYDRGDSNIRVEAASGRRASYYGGLSNPSSNYEDKVRDATGYQADVSGEPIKLTADLLRKQQHTIGSSRSTHSSNSRDESDFKRSVTTRTTRSVSGNDAAGDDVTIRIKGNAKVTIGAAEITNADGVELNIVNNRRQSIRNGSEASRSEYAPSQSQQSQAPALSEYAPTATDERERERERRGRREILGVPGRDRTGSVTGRRRGIF